MHLHGQSEDPICKVHFTGKQLNGIRNIVVGQRGDISQEQSDLPEACRQLHDFDDCIRRLRI